LSSVADAGAGEPSCQFTANLLPIAVGIGLAELALNLAWLTV